MTRVQTVTVEVVMDDGTRISRVMHPRSGGDNPRFLQSQFDPAIETIVEGLRAAVAALYGKQHDPSGPASGRIRTRRPVPRHCGRRELHRSHQWTTEVEGGVWFFCDGEPR